MRNVFIDASARKVIALSILMKKGFLETPPNLRPGPALGRRADERERDPTQSQTRASARHSTVDRGERVRVCSLVRDVRVCR